MKITALETIRIAEFANLLWLKVHTSEGIVGLGETFFLAETVEAYVHECLAQKLLGRNPLEIDRISKDLVGYLRFLALENPHVQHLRRHVLHAQGDRPDDVELWHDRGRARPLRRSQRLSA